MHSARQGGDGMEAISPTAVVRETGKNHHYQDLKVSAAHRVSNHNQHGKNIKQFPLRSKDSLADGGYYSQKGVKVYNPAPNKTVSFSVTNQQLQNNSKGCSSIKPQRSYVVASQTNPKDTRSSFERLSSQPVDKPKGGRSNENKSDQSTTTQSSPVKLKHSSTEPSLPSSSQVLLLEDRHVEGQSTPAEIEKLQSQVNKLKDELEKQAKVNSDLKKLLVASVGDDLHHKVDALVRTKTELANEIGGYTQQMHRDWETVDELTIQADMWRSKYLATRLLADQMTAKEQSTAASRAEAVRALCQMLIERDQLHDTMFYTHRHLKFLMTSFDPSQAVNIQPSIPNILELARTVHLLSEQLKAKLLGNLPEPTLALDFPVQNDPSPAEKFAHEVLCKSPSSSHASSHSASVVPRFHPNSKFEGLTFTCCKKCKGEIKVL